MAILYPLMEQRVVTKSVSSPSQNFDAAVSKKAARTTMPGVSLLVMGGFSLAAWIGIATLVMSLLAH